LCGNPFADPAIAERYDLWYKREGRRADRLEKDLLKRMLAEFPGAHTILEVGCGTGHFARWFERQGMQVVGLEISSAMLAEAIRLGSPLCVRGDALALPFPSGAFDLVALITVLEFVVDPGQALAEALRVARRGVILGVLNRHSLLGQRLNRVGGPIWGVARLLTPTELIRMIRELVPGSRFQIFWRTTLWPLWPGMLPLPWGGFIGMAVKAIGD